MVEIKHSELSMGSRWRKIGAKNSFSLSGIEETLLGGQCFSWSPHGKQEWIGVIRKSLIKLRWTDGQLAWDLIGGQTLLEDELIHYLWLDESYAGVAESLPWRSDPILHRAMDQFLGLRILRQPIEEVLLVFILSSAKSIPQIKQLCERIYHLLGDELMNGVYSFPGWDRLKGLSESEARKLGMGYRAKYLVSTADYLFQKPGFLKEVQAQSYLKARSMLMNLPGVGPKVSDCVLLFGGGKTRAFPIDTWILQSLEKQYGMKGWKISQMEEFSRIHFGEYAGLAQQFLFSYQRNFS